MVIFDALEIQVQHPEIGRNVHLGQRVLMLALRHQRDAGYNSD